jgi:hypothetical protein
VLRSELYLKRFSVHSCKLCTISYQGALCLSNFRIPGCKQGDLVVPLVWISMPDVMLWSVKPSGRSFALEFASFPQLFSEDHFVNRVDCWVGRVVCVFLLVRVSIVHSDNCMNLQLQVWTSFANVIVKWVPYTDDYRKQGRNIHHQSYGKAKQVKLPTSKAHRCP